MSERQVTTYVVDGEEYDVVLQAKPEQRASYSDLSNIFVRADRSGELVPLSNLMALEDMAGPSQLQRHNRMRAVTLSAQLAPGYTLGEALDYLENIIRTRAARHGADRLSRRVARVQGSVGRAVLHVRHRAVRRVPRARGAVRELRASARDHGDGAARRRRRVARLWISGKTLNIYSQIGIIMLVGIAAKNGVLIVEFINQLRDKGMEFKDAIVEASRIRLRPVIMTAFAAVMGSVPLILAEGPGSASRAALGVVIFSGVSLRDVLHAVHRAGRLQPDGARHELAERDRASARRADARNRSRVSSKARRQRRRIAHQRAMFSKLWSATAT